MNFNPKFLFFGTPEFAAIILEKLIKAGFAPAAVVCNPDKPAGRKKIITPPLTKIIAQKYQIPVLQPEKLNKDFIINALSFKPDVFIVAAYAKIIPQEVLEMPRLGTIGIHPSLLPKYRGSSPIQSVILNGEKETGATIFLIDKEVDHGPILVQRKLAPQISNIKFLDLQRELANLSADLLIEILPQFLAGEIIPREQDHSLATLTKKFKTEDAFILPGDLEKAQKDDGDVALIIDQKIRAFDPEPGAWTMINGKRVKLLEVKIVDGRLKLIRIKEEGKRSEKYFS